MPTILLPQYLNIIRNMKGYRDHRKLEELLTFICEQIVVSLGYPIIWLGIKEPNGGVRCLAKAGQAAKYIDTMEVRWDDSIYGQGAVGQAIKKGTIQCFDVQNSEVFLNPWMQIFKELEINTVLSIPIITKDSETVGALTLYCHDTDAFTEEGVSILEAFASQIAMVIDFDRTNQSLNKYRLLSENTRDIILLIEPSGKIIEANKAAVSTYQYTKEELLSRTIFDLRVDQEAVVKEQMSVASERGILFETYHKRKDGSVFPVEVSSVGEIVNGQELFISFVRDISIRKNTLYRLEFLANHDNLTRLPNRNSFTEYLKRTIQDKNEQLFAIMFINIDRFKFINDVYGHEIGDRLLQEVAQRIINEVDEEDIVSRYGGDEFAVLINTIRHRDEILAISSKIITNCSERYIINEQELYISLSMGIAIYPNNGKEIESLLKHADIAMYSAKKNGGNKFHVYISEEDSKPFKSFPLISKLNKALEREEFKLVYQPQFNLTQQKITGAEALIRWYSPAGIVQPLDFIPIAEETGLIIPIGEWVIRTACKQSKTWMEQGYDPLEMSVNISANQFYHPNFVAKVKEILEETGIDPTWLNLEITETIAMQNFESATQIIRQLNSLGVKITVDDFGTGYSSLNYLANLELDFIKLDKSLVENLHMCNKKNSVAKAIIDLAQNLGVKVIAEGVEKEEESKILKENNCDIVQGYLISRPLPPEQAEVWITKTSASSDKLLCS